MLSTMLFRKHAVCNRLLTESCNMIHSFIPFVCGRRDYRTGFCVQPVPTFFLCCTKAQSLPCTKPPVFAGAPDDSPPAPVWTWFLHAALARWFDKSEKSSLTHLRSLLFPPLLCSAFLSPSHCLSPFPLHPYPSLLPFFPYLVFVVKVFHLPRPSCRRAFM